MIADDPAGGEGLRGGGSQVLRPCVPELSAGEQHGEGGRVPGEGLQGGGEEEY